MIPTIEDIVASLLTGKYSKEQAVNWLEAHRDAAADVAKDKDADRLNLFARVADVGCAPALLFDDNGYWAVVDEGMQSVSDGDEPQDQVFSFSVPKDAWKTSVRDAIDAYAAERAEELATAPDPCSIEGLIASERKREPAGEYVTVKRVEWDAQCERIKELTAKPAGTQEPHAGAWRWIDEAVRAMKMVDAAPPEFVKLVNELLQGVPCPQEDLGFDSPADRAARVAPQKAWMEAIASERERCIGVMLDLFDDHPNAKRVAKAIRDTAAPSRNMGEQA